MSRGVILTQRQRGVLMWLSLAHNKEAHLSRYWQEVGVELEALGLVVLVPDFAFTLARLTPAGHLYPVEQDGGQHDD
jgi:hypothetical protein